jgi:hypothetical protein
MRLNIFKSPAIDPYISHMRVVYEDNIRKQTEGYWRIRIAAELKAQGYDTPALFVLGDKNV